MAKIMQIIDGKKIADEVLARLQERVAILRQSHFAPPMVGLRRDFRSTYVELQKNIIPTLGIILIGDDPRSQTYVRVKMQAAEKLGIETKIEQFDETVEVETILQAIKQFNNDDNLHGMIIQLPLPDQLQTDELRIIEAVDPVKDVDGLHPLNLGRLLRGKSNIEPPTPKGVIALLDAYGVEIKGSKVTLIGFGKLVGRALSAMLIDRGATLTVATKSTINLAETTQQADIIISAAGYANLITAEMIKDDVVLIDVGLSEVDPPSSSFALRASDGLRKGTCRLVGDISNEAKEKARLATPVPGGVGPMTVAMLLTNVVEAAERQRIKLR